MKFLKTMNESNSNFNISEILDFKLLKRKEIPGFARKSEEKLEEIQQKNLHCKPATFLFGVIWLACYKLWAISELLFFKIFMVMFYNCLIYFVVSEFCQRVSVAVSHL